MRSETLSAAVPKLLIVAAEDLFKQESDWLQQIERVAQAALHYVAGSIGFQLRPATTERVAHKRNAQQRADCGDHLRRLFERVDPNQAMPIYASARTPWVHASPTWRWHVPEAQLRAASTDRTKPWSASVHSARAAQDAEHKGAHLLIFAPVFAPGWKPTIPVGLAGLATVTRATHVPVLAMGGIKASRVAGCLEAGASGVAVASALMQATDAHQVLGDYASVLSLPEGD
jgi:NAD(P)H-dependent flavin oxidoreductase YrpB (nitropropane dioxygenase family)